MSGFYRDTKALSSIPSCKSYISSNQIFNFFNHFGEVAVLEWRALGASFTEFLTPTCDRRKRKFIVPINMTYFIKYVFGLYTMNAAVIDIGPY
jgi:hypothetical protein